MVAASTRIHFGLKWNRHDLVAHGPPIAAALVLFFGIFFVGRDKIPLTMTEGTITPAIVKPGDHATVSWVQDWDDLCSVTVTREIIGADGWSRKALSYELKPPEKIGATRFSGPLIIPRGESGAAKYRALIQPHCFFDKFWQRSYYTPTIDFFLE